MASSVIGQLRVALSLGTAEFESGAAKAASVAKTRAKEIEGAFSGAKAAVSGLFAAFTVGLLTEQIKKSLEYAGSLREVASTLGVTTTQLQQFRYVASQTGVSQDKLELGLRKLTESMGKAEAGSSKQVKAFQAIHLSVEQLKQMNTGDVFLRLADGVSKYSDRAARAAIETALMSRSGSLLDNALKGGSARINELSEAANRLGIVLSSSQIAGAEETAHKLEAVKMVLSAQIAGVVADNANAILSLSQALGQLTVSVIRFLGSNPQLALGIIGALAGRALGGPIGLAVGALGGASLGAKVAQSALDSNPDLKVRTQQMRAAQQRYFEALNGGTKLTSVSGRPIEGSGLRIDPTAAKAEFIRQIHLLQQATGQARSNALPPSPDLPQFLAGKTPHAKKPPQDKTEADEFEFAQQQRQTDIQILEAKKALSHSFVEQVTISLQTLDIQEKIKDADIDHKLAQAARDLKDKKIDKATYNQLVIQADIEKADEAHLIDLQKRAIIDAALERTDQAIFDGQDQQRKFGLEALQAADGLAMTQAEHRKIQLEILDAEIEQRRLELEHSKQLAIRNGATQQEIANIQAQIDHLPTERAQGAAAIGKSTQGPLEQYMSGLPTTAAKWQEALQGVAVNGFGALETAIMSTLDGTKKLGAAFGDMAKSILADLLKISIERAIIGPLANGLFGSSGTGGLLGGLISGGGGGFGSSSFLNTLSPISSGLLNAPAISPGPALGFASGGSFTIGGNMGTDRNVMAINGVRIARVGYGERVSVTPRGAANGNGSTGDVHIHAPITINSPVTRETAGQLARELNIRIAQARAKGF